MKTSIILALAASALCGTAYAQSATPAAPAVVTFTDMASMPGLTDKSQKNSFKVTVSDAQIDLGFTVTCTPGGSALLLFHKDKVCGVAGAGSVVNPVNKAELPRTQYLGGYDVKDSGIANGDGMQVQYLALGNAAASTVPFGGEMHLKAQLNASGLSAIEQTISNKLNLNNAADTTIDKRLDTVSLNGLFIPSAGWPSDKGCTWDGSMVFAYQTNSWFIDLSGQCNGQKYDLKGNMPWTPSKGVSNQMQYDLNLTLPNAKIVGDDALFGGGDAADLFASVDGIHGQIIQKNSDMVTIQVDGQPTDTPSRVDATGTLTGTNVPLPVVRSVAVLFGLISDNLFGA